MPHYTIPRPTWQGKSQPSPTAIGPGPAGSLRDGRPIERSFAALRMTGLRVAVILSKAKDLYASLIATTRFPMQHSFTKHIHLRTLPTSIAVPYPRRHTGANRLNEAARRGSAPDPIRCRAHITRSVCRYAPKFRFARYAAKKAVPRSPVLSSLAWRSLATRKPHPNLLSSGAEEGVTVV